MSVLTCDNVAFAYDAGHPVLSGVSFTLTPDAFTCVLGTNGSGKTTLLKLLAGFLRPDSGEIRIDGQAVARLDFRVRARRVTVVPQNVQSPLDYNVEEFLLTLAEPFALSPTEKSQKIAAALALFDLAGFQLRDCATLSGGELKRVVLAGAYAFHGEFLLLDEPTAPLDPRHALQVMRLFSTLDCGILMITHSIPTALRFARQTLLLKDGRLVADTLDAAALEKTFACHFTPCVAPDGTVRAFAAE